MSGPFVLWAAEQHPDRVAAAASIHGVQLYSDDADSPHRNIERITGEVYVAHAEHDPYAPTEMIEAFTARMKTTTVRHRIEWYRGAHHGFAFPKRTDMYDRDSAERHWERLHSLFRRNLY
jgi:carboxymethylenebutenolidase